jgi:Putative beta-barrel porin-2, OmpL-like. bbp2
MRLFHNVYGIFNVTDKLGLTLGIDIGTEEKTPSGGGTNTWYAPVGILKYSFNEKWTVAGRLEYYNDKNGVIISTGTQNGFQTFGYSLNLDYSAAKNVLLRVEARNFSSKDEVFVKQSQMVKGDDSVAGSIAVSF